MKKGDIIGNYVLGVKLYESIYSQIYEVKHKGNGEVSVLKVGRESSDKEAQAGYDNIIVSESLMLPHLSHPSIVRYKDAAVLNDRPHLFLEKVDGCTLFDFFSEVSFSSEQLHLDCVIHVIRDILDALIYLHSVRHSPRPHGGKNTSILWGDVAPSNALIDSDLHVKCIDFGIAGYQSLPGSVAYQYIIMREQFAAPERLLDRPLTPASDIFSLGSSLMFCLTRKPVYYDVNFPSGEVTFHDEAFADCTKIFRQHPQLEELIRSALEREPHDRPTAQEMRDKITTFRNSSLKQMAHIKKIVNKLKKKRM